MKNNEQLLRLAILLINFPVSETFRYNMVDFTGSAACCTNKDICNISGSII